MIHYDEHGKPAYGVSDVPREGFHPELRSTKVKNPKTGRFINTVVYVKYQSGWIPPTPEEVERRLEDYRAQRDTVDEPDREAQITKNRAALRASRESLAKPAMRYLYDLLQQMNADRAVDVLRRQGKNRHVAEEQIAACGRIIAEGREAKATLIRLGVEP